MISSKHFFIFSAYVLAFSAFALIAQEGPIKIDDVRLTLDFRVRECLVTAHPGMCVRNRGLVIPNQNNIHRFVIYGGALNVNTTLHSSAPNDNPEQLSQDFTQLLISSSSRLNGVDGLGLTPLDYAAKNSNMYRILKRAGARLSTEL